MENNLICKGYIPLDKSWMMRIGVLDLINGHVDCINFLKEQNYLSDDLKSLYRASIQWNSDKLIDVGESGTLYRFFKFVSWKLNADKKFILKGTLKDRKICDDQKIINWTLKKLLILDNKTSQWASASVLMGNQEKIENPPYKLQVTYDAVQHWNNAKQNNEGWEPRYDETILRQASAYLKWTENGKIDFIPQQAEDYCFARAFELISAEEGEKRWPSLRSHESDRIEEMERALKEKEITSKDHRVIQAIAMLKRGNIHIIHPESVNKSWPQFWKFLKDSSHL